MMVTLALNGLNETFYRQMTTIMTFFLQISALFSNFCKIAGENSPFLLYLRVCFQSNPTI